MTNIAVPLFDSRDDVPDRESYVLGQGFRRDIEKCKALLPDSRMWPPELDEAPMSGTRRLVDRGLIFRIAERASSDNEDEWAASQLHAAIAVWGAPPGIPMTRAIRPLAESGVGHKLSQAMRLVRGEGPESAYKALSRNGRLRVANLGPSYFTKFLYFGGFGAKQHMPQPLIMDDNVIEGLKAVTKQPWTASAADYVRYLDRAAEWATEFSTSADVIERRLYEIGE